MSNFSCLGRLKLLNYTFPGGRPAKPEINANLSPAWLAGAWAELGKITVIGSAFDITYYSDVCPWVLGDEKVKVGSDNDHLGQIVSGVEQEQKNVDARIKKG